MWQLLLLSALSVLNVAQCDHHVCPSGYSRGRYLDASTQNYLLCWKVDWTDKSITFLAKVATTGWIGLGFSSTGFMPNSDVIIGWVKDGQGYLKDRFATARLQPPIDEIQNVKLLSFSEADGMTTLEFKRDLDACEPRDKSIQEGTNRVIIAYHPSDPVSETTVAMHSFATRVSVNLLSGTGNVKSAHLEDNYKTVDVLNRNVSLSAKPTTYWCTPFKLPELQKEAHIIGIEPLVQANHKKLVHHILIYTCHAGLDPYLDTSWDCFDSPNSIPLSIQACILSAEIAGWAIGGLGVFLPSQVGLPMSGRTGIQYVLMETHYNNEERRADYVDSSGLRIFYTPTKRQYDAAIVEFGHVESLYAIQLLLPPGRDNIITENICPAACTQTGLPPGGVNVFGTLLHSHIAGRSIWIEHFRNGVQLPNIDSNYNYDFSFQEVTLLRNEVKILPGDEVKVICAHDTTGRQRVTIGGLGTLDEMCQAFIFVYPKPDLSFCLSQNLKSNFENYIRDATRMGYFTDLRDTSADPITQYKQYVQSIVSMNFSTEAAYTLWNQQYRSTKEREYECTGTFHNNLLGAKDFNYTVFPTITQSLTDAPTATGAPKSCRGVVTATKSPTSSAFDFTSNSFWAVFLFVVVMLMN
ncbi:DBH-like monooxygenase protein 1 homolog [Corticium candelabrum]|uniref:DBH-like monooxygenase protein 1 homolog n=1 Tax=Corticium candelabrum TaxID=121492 RepID=UPI002E26304D|nr:DBH-like monooxygenase protein 1 homolog [Corticium candelabrum]